LVSNAYYINLAASFKFNNCNSSKMATNFTKTKWSLQRHSPNTFRIEAENRIGSIIDIHADPHRGGGYALSIEEAEANADLVFSSKALYEALNGMVKIFDRGLEEGTIGRKYCDSAIEALKMANKSYNK